MQRYSKAIIALLGALATWGLTAAEDNVYTQVELWGALAAVVTAVGVYAWPNDAPTGQPADPDVSERGHADLGSLAVVALISAAVTIILLVTLGEELVR